MQTLFPSLPYCQLIGPQGHIIHTIYFFKLMFFHLAIDVTKKGYQKRKLIEFYIVSLRDIWGSWDNTQPRLDDYNTSTFSIPE